MVLILQIEEYSRKQAELESKLNVANKRVSYLKVDRYKLFTPLWRPFWWREATEDWGEKEALVWGRGEGSVVTTRNVTVFDDVVYDCKFSLSYLFGNYAPN